MERLEALIQLIDSKEFSDQQSLIEALKADFGIETNQAAISRDLHKLGVVKKKIDDKLIYQIGSIDAKAEILRLGVSRIDHNEVMIIVHTLGGLADFVGDYIDEHLKEEILGTLAGENVVFISPKSIHNIVETYNKLTSLLHYSEEV